MGTSYLAHSPSRDGSRTDRVADHLKSVAARAAEYASAFGAADEAYLAGLLHDLGKYGELFQRRLRGEAEHVDHWSAGAWQLLENFRSLGLAAALAIQGHHVGLQRADKPSLAALNPARWDPRMHDGRRLSESDPGVLMQRLTEDGLSLTATTGSIYNHAAAKVAAMLDVRVLFSVLVDADFIETEAHFEATNGEKVCRKAGPQLEPTRALSVLLARIGQLASTSEASQHIRELRADLLAACLAAAEQSQGRFTLTAPTGSGKTLAMLAFALKHAARHNLRRVVMVIPYLNIIDQTASVYRSAFEPELGVEYVLEHHSLVGARGEAEVTDVNENRLGKLAENWDAPIVVTTSVQMLESLFSNRPSACRKLHRLAKSVILFDEVQTLPTRLAVPTLAALSRLVECYATTVVFATATRPAFSQLNGLVRTWCDGGWQPAEIVPAGAKLFDRARRTKVEWPDLDSRVNWDDIVRTLAGEDCKQVLCVVNLKRHALLLFQKLQELLGSDVNLFHLSTSMCPAHRRVVLDDVRKRLSGEKPCRLVSTQCVEAGVDVDFPVAFRAWGPLDSIAQVAGRCNRNGLRNTGRMHVFIPESEEYPDGAYAQAAAIARVVGRTRGLDIDDPDMFHEYYCRLYSIARPGDRDERLLEAIGRQDFAEVAALYHIIPDVTINVLVPYDLEAFGSLSDEVRQEGISRDWIRRARPYTIGIYRPRPNAPVARWLEPVPGADGSADCDWYVYLRPEHYNHKTGLTPPEALDCLIG